MRIVKCDVCGRELRKNEIVNRYTMPIKPITDVYVRLLEICDDCFFSIAEHISNIQRIAGMTPREIIENCGENVSNTR